MRERLRHYRRHVGYAAILAVAIALFGADPVSGQPFAAQIQALLRRSNTWLGTQTFTNVTVTGTCTGCGGVTYPLLAPDGTSGAPSYSFSNQATTGMYRPAANTIRFAGGGADMLQLGGSANLAATGIYMWSNASNLNNADTGFSRTAAGVVALGDSTAGNTTGTLKLTNILLTAVLFAALGTPANGTVLYCSDCTVTTVATCPTTQASCVCAGSGTGAIARRINSTWYCTF